VDLDEVSDLFGMRLYVDRADLHSFPTRRSSDLSASTTPFRILLQRLSLLIEKETATSAAMRPAHRAFRRCSSLHMIQRASKDGRSEEHTSELQSRFDVVCRLLLEKKKERAERVL